MGNSATQKIIPKCHDPITILTDGNDLCNKYFGDPWVFNSVEKADCPDKYLRAQCKKNKNFSASSDSDNYIHKQIIFEKDPIPASIDIIEEDNYDNPINNVSYDELAPCNFSKCQQYNNTNKCVKSDKNNRYIDKKQAEKKITVRKANNHMERVLRPESTEKYRENFVGLMRTLNLKEGFSDDDPSKNKQCNNSIFHNIIHVIIFFLCVYLLYYLFSSGSGLM